MVGKRSALSMITQCMKHQGEHPVPYGDWSGSPHQNHPEVIPIEEATFLYIHANLERLVPNLRLWNGSAHKFIMELKDDSAMIRAIEEELKN